MTTSQRTPFLSEVLEAGRISEVQLEYFRARLMLRFYSMIQSTFHRLRRSKPGFSKADLARRLGKGPEQITRWMNSPGNLTLKTVSDLLLAMGHEPALDVRDLEQGAVAPTQEAWLRPSSVSVDERSASQLLTKLAVDTQKMKEKITGNLIEIASKSSVARNSKAKGPTREDGSTDSALAKAQEVGDQEIPPRLSVPGGGGAWGARRAVEIRPS